MLQNPGIATAQTLLLMVEHPVELAAVTAAVRAAPTLAATATAAAAAGAGGDILQRCCLETLRLTAHTIGAIRKVVDPAGFILVTGAGGKFFLPFNSYVGASHLLPHLVDANYPDAARFSPDRFADGPPDDTVLTTFRSVAAACPGPVRPP